MNKYYSLTKTENEATINIYGDITSWAWEELGEVSAVNLSRQLEALGEVSQINVYINSYGGEVAEGLAIYNALKRHNAKVKTVCDGFACSIASVIFMAGDERVMNESSLLMIHNAWTSAVGNAEELRKQADDLEKITQASVNAYVSNSNLTEKEVKDLMDAESWLLPTEALEYGFATSIQSDGVANVSQNAKMKVLDIFKKYRAQAEEQPEDETPEDEEETDGETPETEETEAEEQPEAEEEQENPAQKWSGFFNAMNKIVKE